MDLINLPISEIVKLANIKILDREEFIKKLTIPIAIIDTETTGTNVVKDRICSMAIKKIFPDGKEDNRYTLIDPECHIPAEATAIHGITDDHIKEANAPTFAKIAGPIAGYLKGCVLATFNGDRFDIVIIAEEFNRVGIQFPEEGFKSLDGMTIFHEKEKRDLSAAKVFYTGEEIQGAHNAAADVEATYEVLLGQIARYDDLREMNIEQLAEFTRKKDAVDMGGRLKRTEENIIVFNFGKHKDKPAAGVFKTDHSYYTWLMSEKYEAPVDSKKWFTKIYNHVNGKK